MTDINDQQPPAVFSFESEFEDFDSFAESVEGWDLDWQQLDRGRLRAQVQQVGTPSVQMNRIRFSRRYHQRGATPPGFLTFGLLRTGTQELNWCGQQASVENLLVFRPGSEYESVSPPGFGGYTFSFSEELLNRYAHHFGPPDPGFRASRENEVLACDPERLTALRSRLRGLCDMARASSWAGNAAAFRDQIERSLARHLLEALASSGTEPDPGLTSAVRSRAARGALSLIRDQPHEPLTVLDLCRAVEVSERTLRYAFREFTGVTPKQYLQAHRLNGVRRELRIAEKGIRVADVANRWGFWHMGQFAADYRRQFGELPSKTLGKN